jgi:hypothetical protein
LHTVLLVSETQPKNGGWLRPLSEHNMHDGWELQARHASSVFMELTSMFPQALLARVPGGRTGHSSSPFFPFFLSQIHNCHDRMNFGAKKETGPRLAKRGSKKERESRSFPLCF